MITTIFPNTRPASFNILAQELICDTVISPVIRDKGDYCWCSVLCAPTLKVFAGNNNKENDRNDFLFLRVYDNDTIDLELWKNGVKLADIEDNTYGDYYPFTSLPNINLKGFLADWKKIYDIFGAGNYRVKANQIILGQSVTFESALFSMSFYNEIEANKTVRIETYQNGYIENNPINYSAINWYSQIRLEGSMKNKQPVIEDENYQDTLRKRNQIQTRIINNYDLEIYEITDDLKDNLISFSLLANEIYITDYSIDNNDRYLPVPVYPLDITELSYNVNMPGASLKLKFIEKTSNNLKRNIF